MMSRSKGLVPVALFAACLAAVWVPTLGAAPTCDPDNGGITLPAGFCALVVADGLGAGAPSRGRRPTATSTSR